MVDEKGVSLVDKMVAWWAEKWENLLVAKLVAWMVA
jgi:hypothetical protein